MSGARRLLYYDEESKKSLITFRDHRFMRKNDLLLLDDEAFGKLQKGDQLAFKAVYDSYVGFVQYLCRLYFPDQKDQDDIIQEVWFRPCCCVVGVPLQP